MDIADGRGYAPSSPIDPVQHRAFHGGVRRLLKWDIVFENDLALNWDGDADPGMYPFELAFYIIEETVDVEDGTLTVPDDPGLGVTVDLNVVEEYPATDGTWTEFRYAAD